MLHGANECLAITATECHQYAVSTERNDLAGNAHHRSLGEEWHGPVRVEKIQITQVFHYPGCACTKYREHTVRVGHIGHAGAGAVVRCSFGLCPTQLPDRGLGAVHAGDQKFVLD